MSGTFPPMTQPRIPPWMRDFIKSEMPELNSALGPLTLPQVREVFNEICSMNVKGDESISVSCHAFQYAMMDMKRAGELVPDGQQRGLEKIAEIKGRTA